MLLYRLYYVEYLCGGMLIVSLLVAVCAIYAYSVNSRRPDDDPQKRNYHLIAIILAPITFPLFIVFSLSIFIMRVLTYGIFLILFTVALIAFRKPFLLAWLRKAATTIGDALLEANTLLIKLFLRPWVDRPETI